MRTQKRRRATATRATAPSCPLHPPWSALSACHPSTAFSSYQNAWTAATSSVSSAWPAYPLLRRVAVTQWLAPCAVRPRAWPRAGAFPLYPRSQVCCLARRAWHPYARAPCDSTAAEGSCTCGHRHRPRGHARVAQRVPRRLHLRCASAARCRVACP